jgi:hypothetical protein
MSTLKNIQQGVPGNLLQPGVDKRLFDNGAWYVAIGGTLLRADVETDPGTHETQDEPFYEDQRNGPLDRLNNRADETSRIRIDLATGQRAFMEAAYWKQATFRSKAEANAYNVVGDPSKAAGPSALASADIGHLILVKVELESGGLTYQLDMPRQYYGDVDSSASGQYRFSSYSPGVFEDIESSSQGGTLTWGTNKYMGECSTAGITFTAGTVLTYDSSQQYTVTLSDGIKVAEIPEWADGDYEIDDGDSVVILNCCYFHSQFGSDADSSSYQMNPDFNSFERVPLEMFRTLGDAAGGKSANMIRRVYPRCIMSSPHTEATRGDDGTVTRRTLEFMSYPDDAEFGDGSHFFEQQFKWT